MGRHFRHEQPVRGGECMSFDCWDIEVTISETDVEVVDAVWASAPSALIADVHWKRPLDWLALSAVAVRFDVHDALPLGCRLPCC